MSNHDEEYDDENAETSAEHHDESLQGALLRQWGAAPWYLGSFGIHMVVFTLMLLFAPDPMEKKEPAIKIVTEPIDEEIKEEPEDTQEVIDLSDPVENQDQSPTDAVTDVSVVTDVPNDVSVDVEANAEEAPAETADFSDANDVVPPTLGLNSVNPTAGRSSGNFGSRSGLAKAGAMKKGGMGTSAKKSLAAGLQWLAKVQEEDGSWNSTKYDGKGHDLSITSLALLAFLGDGHSSKTGKYRKEVRKAQNWLASKFNKQTNMIGEYRYEAAVTMMGMAEAWAMSEEKNIGDIVKAQVAKAEECQNPNGGWGYRPVAQDGTGGDQAHVDVSVAGWWIMALKSAKVAGAKISDKCWNGAMKYLKEVSFEQADKTRVTPYRTGNNSHLDNMTAVGLTCLQFLGLEAKDKYVAEQANAMLKNKWILGNSGGQKHNNFYGWYYQALGFFQLGLKSPCWQEFKKSFEPTLLRLQDRGGFYNGSWSAEGGRLYEGQIGRVGVTATACLMLEVYFRFENVHEGHGGSTSGGSTGGGKKTYY